MVFASTCEHESSAFIFASTSSDPICFASSEHFVNFLGARDLGSLSWIEKKRFALSNLPDESQQLTANCTLLAMMSNYVRYLRVSFSAVHQVNVQGDPKLSNPMGGSLKLPDFQVLWHGRFLVIFNIFLGNANNAAFSQQAFRASVSMIGKPIDQKRFGVAEALFSGGFKDLTS